MRRDNTDFRRILLCSRLVAMAQRGIAVARDAVPITGRICGAVPASTVASGAIEIRGTGGAAAATQCFAAVSLSAVRTLGARRVVDTTRYAFLEGTNAAACTDADLRSPTVGIAVRIARARREDSGRRANPATDGRARCGAIQKVLTATVQVSATRRSNAATTARASARDTACPARGTASGAPCLRPARGVSASRADGAAGSRGAGIAHRRREIS
jgi:hypothetical protein